MSVGLSWRWASSSLPETDRSSAWMKLVNHVYGTCDFAHSVPSNYDASIDTRSVDMFHVTNLICDPIEGRQVETNPNGAAAQSFSVQLIESGEKLFSSEGESVVGRAGDVLINLGCLRNGFEVRERSHEITVTMPLARLKAWMPGSLRRRRYKLPADSAGALLLTSTVKSVSSAFLSGSLNNGLALTEAMIGIVVASIGNEIDANTPRAALLAQIKSYISAHLNDPDLSPRQIAAVKRISVRYLHALFEAESTTVQQYVIRERLLRCRRDLQNPCMRNRTITEIAYDCGFQNSTHFSRRFKDEFGASPSQFRADGSRQSHPPE